MAMQLPLGQLAALLGGELSDPTQAEVVVSNVAPLDAAKAGDLAFLWDPAFAQDASTSNASAIITKDPIEGRCCILVANPQQAMLLLLGQVHSMRDPAPSPGVHPKAHVDETAELAEGVSVGANATVEAHAKIGANTQIRPNAYIGRNVVTGSDCVIHPNATILGHCVLGDRTVVWSGAVIGKDGFGFVPNSGNRRDLSQGSTRVPQIGGVRLGNDVEVGSLTTVDRGALEVTEISDNVIIDSQVHIAHNCKIGDNTVVIGRFAMAGGAKIGKNTYCLQASALGQGRTVGDGAILGSGAQVLYKDVPDGAEVLGWPAKPVMRERRLQVILRRLSDTMPALKKRVKNLEKQLAAQSADDAPGD
jgi:UDP-3-O-[3-hydroxymyristoyl] glucosamine N-acyltransferase